MPRASAESGRHRAGGVATSLLVAVAALLPAVAVAAPLPSTDEFAPVPVQADSPGDGPYGMAVGDRNGDGLPDAFVARWNAGDVVIRQGTAGGGPGLGRMDDDVVVPIGGRTREVEAVDWDGDGLDDAVALLGDDLSTDPQDEGALHVWTGGLGVVTVATPSALNLATGDIDGDGDLDAVVISAGGRAHIIRNETLAPGAPALGHAGELAVCATATDVELADVSGDGHLDLVVACQGANTIQVWSGNGAGAFDAVPVVTSAAGTAPYRLASGDVDGDGIPDIAVTGTGSVRILRGLGGASASLGAPATYAISGAPRRPLLADLDGDGRPDLAGTTTSPNGIGYRLNRGDGTFGGERRISWAADAWDLGAADVTGDGRQDLIAIAFSVDGFGVWEGRAAAEPVAELSGLAVGVYEGATGIELDPGARVLGADSPTAVSATVSIPSGRVIGDVLTAAPPAPLTTSWNGATGTLMLSAPAPQPNSVWRAALRTVRFAHVAPPAGGAAAGRRTVRAQIGAFAPVTRSIDVWLRPPDAGDVELDGIPVIGETLSPRLGAWGGTPPVALNARIERCAVGGSCSAIGVSLPYRVRQADLGLQLRLRVEGTGPDGTTMTAFSARTATVRALAAPTVLSGPPAETFDREGEIGFAGEPGATFLCWLDGGAEQACGSPVRYAGLGAGAHTISIVQLLPSGARSAAAVRGFTVKETPNPPDETPPRPPDETPRPPDETPRPPDTPRPPKRSRTTRSALVAPRKATAAQLRRGLVVRVTNVTKGAKATATLRNGKRGVVSATTKAGRAGTLQLRLRAANASVARLGRRATLGLSVTIAPPRAKRVTLSAKIAYRR